MPGTRLRVLRMTREDGLAFLLTAAALAVIIAGQALLPSGF